MRVVLAGGGGGMEAEDFARQEVVARQIALAAQHDYWLIVYDFYGTRVFDTVVQARVLALDGEGQILADGDHTGSPDQQIFAITRTLPEDAVKLREAFTAEMPAQVAWKRLPHGSFYVPLEWANHTKGLPNVGPHLVARWERGEKPDIMTRWRKLILMVRDWSIWLLVGSALIGLYWWLGSWA